jgi:membrane protein
VKIPGLDWLRQRFAAARLRWRWLDLAASVFRKGGRDGAGRLAAVVGYYAFFSLFPLLLVLVFVVGVLLGDSTWRDRILDSAFVNFPVIGEDISKNVGQLEGRGPALVIGALTALWAGTHAFDAFDHAMHVVWDGTRAKGSSFLRRRLRAVLQLGVLGGALVVTTAATVVLNTVVRIPGAARPASVLLSIALNVAFAVVLYRVAETEHRGWRVHIPGAIVAGLGLTVLQLLGQYYLTRLIDTAGDTYGVFAVVIGLLSWLHLLASLLIWSAELSVVLWLRDTRNEGLRKARRHSKAPQVARADEPAT